MDPHKVINFTVFILVVAMFLIVASEPRSAITGGVIQENIQEVLPEVTAQEDIARELTAPDLIFFVKTAINDNFKGSKGAFVKDSACEEDCEIWHYPYQGEIKEKVYAKLQKFHPGEMGTLEALKESGHFTSLTDLANGQILINDLEEEYHDSIVKRFETAFSCNDEYWVQIGISRLTFRELSEKGAVLEATNSIIDFCNDY